VVEAASGLGEIWVVGGEKHEHPHISGFIEDLEEGGGPLQAVLAAMRAQKGSPLLILACDIPFIRPDLLKHIAAPLAPEFDARIPRLDGLAQPLAAHYSHTARPYFEDAWAVGIRAMHKAWEKLDVEWLDVEKLRATGLDPEQLNDFDNPEDLARLLEANQDS
jgi:molybdopterin-guanine dinucleotide biosynthesis protein A